MSNFFFSNTISLSGVCFEHVALSLSVTKDDVGLSNCYKVLEEGYSDYYIDREREETTNKQTNKQK